MWPQQVNQQPSGRIPILKPSYDSTVLVAWITERTTDSRFNENFICSFEVRISASPLWFFCDWNMYLFLSCRALHSCLDYFKNKMRRNESAVWITPVWTTLCIQMYACVKNYHHLFTFIEASMMRVVEFHNVLNQIQLGPMKSAPLLNKYYWNEGVWTDKT